MTDFTHHTPRLLSEADAAADLAGLARPIKGLRLLYDYGQAITESGDSEQIYMNYAAAREYIKAMEHERDALAARVAELETEVLDQCRLNGMGSERELALMGRVAELEAALKPNLFWNDADPEPSDAERLDAARWRAFIGLDYALRAEWATNLSLAPILTKWVDNSIAAMTETKGGK